MKVLLNKANNNLWWILPVVLGLRAEDVDCCDLRPLLVDSGLCETAVRGRPWTSTEMEVIKSSTTVKSLFKTPYYYQTQIWI